MQRHHLTRLATTAVLVVALAGCWAPGGGVPNACQGRADRDGSAIALTQQPGSEPGTTQWVGHVESCLRGNGDPSDAYLVTIPAGYTLLSVTCSASVVDAARFDVTSTIIDSQDTGCADPGFTSGASIGALPGTDATITVEPGSAFQSRDVGYELVINILP